MTTTVATEPGTATAIPRESKLIITVLLVAAFVVILNETIIGVALPHLMGDLDISANTVQWLSTAFMLTMAVVIPTTGFALQRLTTRTVFILAMSLFLAGTGLAAVSPGFWLLLVGRIVQASGTAMMMPLLMTTVLTLVPIARRGVVMGNIGIAISVAPAIGPTVSGLILQFLPWRFMFVVVLPVAALALLIGMRKLTNVGERNAARLDPISVLLTVPAFGGTVYGLSRLTEQGAGRSVGLAVAGLGVLALVAFGWRQRTLERGAHPLLDLRAFGFGQFRIAVVVLCVAMMSLFAMVILLPIYLQTVRGLSALATGMLLLPGGLAMGLLGPVVGRLFDRHGPTVLAMSGAATLAASMFAFSRAAAGTPVWLLLVVHVATMMSLACLFTPSFTAGLNPLPPSLYSHGSAVMTTLQQVSGAAATAVLVMIMTARARAGAARGAAETVALNEGISLAFLVAAGIALVAVVAAAFLRRQPAPALTGDSSNPSSSAMAH